MFKDRNLIIATMHRKEKVIAPLLEAELQVHAEVCKQLDTDAFGTFTREVPRIDTQVETAKQKALKALALSNETLAIASEGSFGPHPALPFVACNIELVVLIDTKNNLEVLGQALSFKTNFAYQEISTMEDALTFAVQAQFPSHGLVIIYETGQETEVMKGLSTKKDLSYGLKKAFKQSVKPTIQIETDMRAHFNPTRMNVIREATLNLLEKLRCHCPFCNTPGYAASEYLSGLPCEYCGFPTRRIKTIVYRCSKCQFEENKSAPGANKSQPGECPICNP